MWYQNFEEDANNLLICTKSTRCRPSWSTTGDYDDSLKLWQWVSIPIPSNILWEELVEREPDGATKQHEKCEEMELAAWAKPWGGVSGRVAAEVKKARDSVHKPEESRKPRILQAAHEQHGEENGQKLDTVLVASLYAIECLCVLVLTLEGVHRWVRHIILLTRHPHLQLHSKRIKNQYDPILNLLPEGTQKHFLG